MTDTVDPTIENQDTSQDVTSTSEPLSSADANGEIQPSQRSPEEFNLPDISQIDDSLEIANSFFDDEFTIDELEGIEPDVLIEKVQPFLTGFFLGRAPKNLEVKYGISPDTFEVPDRHKAKALYEILIYAANKRKVEPDQEGYNEYLKINGMVGKRYRQFKKHSVEDPETGEQVGFLAALGEARKAVTEYANENDIDEKQRKAEVAAKKVGIVDEAAKVRASDTGNSVNFVIGRNTDKSFSVKAEPVTNTVVDVSLTSINLSKKTKEILNRLKRKLPEGKDLSPEIVTAIQKISALSLYDTNQEIRDKIEEAKDAIENLDNGTNSELVAELQSDLNAFIEQARSGNRPDR